MKCTKCGKTFASHTDGSEICWDCYMKDYDDYVKNNFSEALQTGRFSNCDMPLPHGFGKQEGWICPVCGRGVAPWVDYCPCQINRNITWATGTGIGTYTNLDAKEFEKYATTDCEELKL